MSRPGDTLPYPARDPDPRHPVPTPTTPAVVATDDSAISWAAILAGAAAAASLSLILVLLGTGLGLSSVSPWSFEGVSAETFGWAAIAWIAFCSIAASGLGGYLTGRLRRRWSGVASDETYFRDTAHGFLAWGVATLVTAATLTTAIGGLLGTGARAGATVAGAGISAAAGSMAEAFGDSSDHPARGVLDYYVDHLFRDDRPAVTSTPSTPPARVMTDDDNAASANEVSEPSAMRQTTDARSPRLQRNTRPEATRILVNSLRTSTLDANDTRYLARLVAERTGIDAATAEARVTEVHGQLVQSIDTMTTQAREAADEARKAAAYAALWLFITLLMGAFTASWLATMGGRHRDL